MVKIKITQNSTSRMFLLIVICVPVCGYVYCTTLHACVQTHARSLFCKNAITAS